MSNNQSDKQKDDMKTYTVAFFGHRKLDNWSIILSKLEDLIKSLLLRQEFITFLVGKNGDFDQMVSSTVRQYKRSIRNDNSSLSLILPYLTEDIKQNEDSFTKYYDEIEICDDASTAHFKRAITIRNQYMIDRADLIVACVERKSGGAYQALCYAQTQNKPIINLSSTIKTP